MCCKPETRIPANGRVSALVKDLGQVTKEGVSFPDPIVSLSLRGPRTRKRRALETGFAIPDSRTFGVHGSSIVLNMAALRRITFAESLCEALSGLNVENISLLGLGGLC